MPDSSSLSFSSRSLLVVLLIAGVAALVADYARAYMSGHPQFGAFYTYMPGFMVAMIGLVSSSIGNTLKRPCHAWPLEW